MSGRAAREGIDWGAILAVAWLSPAWWFVVNGGSRIVDTIRDLGVGHDVRDVASTVYVLGALVALIVGSHGIDRRSAGGTAARADQVEERRAWLADLREQGAPWRRRAVQRLSLTLVAVPVLAVRRGLLQAQDLRRPRVLVAWSLVVGTANGAAFALSQFTGFDWRQIPVMIVLSPLLCLFGGWIARRAARRKAEREAERRIKQGGLGYRTVP